MVEMVETMEAMMMDPENKITYHDKENGGIVKGIELKPGINNKAIGEVITTSNFTNNKNIKKKLSL